MPVYYPSCIVKMALTFDEVGQKPDTIAEETSIGDGSKNKVVNKKKTMDFDENGVASTLYTQSSAGETKNADLFDFILKGSPYGSRSVGLTVQPMDAQIECQGVRDGDRATVKLDFRKMPIDARSVRSCLLAIYLGTVKGSDYASGMGGWFKSKDPPRSLVQHTDPKAKFLRFLGYVDDFETDYGDKTGTITIKARDLTAVYIDMMLDQAEVDSIRLDRPIGDVVQDIVCLRKSTSRTPIRVLGKNPEVESKGSTSRVLMGAKGNKSTAGSAVQPSQESNIRMWDLIVSLCAKAAVIPTVNVGEIVIQPPSSLFSDTGAPRKFVFGQNVKTMTFSRKLGMVTAPTIEYRCNVVGQKAPISARWPVKKQATKIKAGGRESEEMVQIRLIHESVSQEMLLQMAKADYEMAGRQELQGKIETMDLSSFESNPDDADLITMRTGSKIEVMFRNKNDSEMSMVVGTVSRLFHQGIAQVAQYLAGLGYPDAVAIIMARSFDAAKSHSTFFYVRNINYRFDSRKGITVSFDFVNAIEHRIKKAESDAGVEQ